MKRHLTSSVNRCVIRQGRLDTGFESDSMFKKKKGREVTDTSITAVRLVSLATIPKAESFIYIGFKLIRFEGNTFQHSLTITN